MKNFTLFVLFLCSIGFAQRPGDLVSSELKLDLSATGVISWIDEGSQGDLYQWVYDYLDQFPYGMQAYKITYKSLDYNDELVNATGLIMFPKTNHKMSNILFMSPTTENRENVPSNLKGTYELGIVIPMLMVASEYIVIAPDYLGMGDGDGELAYIEDKTAASAGLDMLSAANQFLDQLGKQRYDEYYVTGYSQGGHAAMAVTMYNQELSNPYNIDYVVSGAGPYDMSNTMLNGAMLDQVEYPNSAFIAYVMYTCHNIGFPQYYNDWNEVIADEFMDQFTASAINGEGGLDWGPLVWRDLFQEDYITNLENDPNHPARRCAESNDVYDFYNQTPTMMLSSSNDETVIEENDEVTLNAQRDYYPWWDLGKYQIQKNSMGPWDHTIGAFPYLLGAVFHFNSKRTGGFFNGLAANTGEYSDDYDRPAHQSASLEFIHSSIAPAIKGATNLNEKGVKQNTSTTLQDLSTVKDEVSIIEITLADGSKRSVPFMKQHAIELPAKDVVEINHSSLKLDMQQWPRNIETLNFIEGNEIVYTFKNIKDSKTFNFDLNDLPSFDTIEVIADVAIFTVKIPNTNPILEDNSYVLQQDISAHIIGKKAIKQVDVYNMQGNLILSTQGKNQNEMSIRLEDGIYIINMTYTDGTTESVKHIQK